MKPTPLAALLAAVPVYEASACCPETPEVQFAGWSRDGSRAVVILSPDTLADDVDLPPAQAWLIDTKTGRVLERMETGEWDPRFGCDPSQPRSKMLRTLIRWARIAPVAPEAPVEVNLRLRVRFDPRKWGTTPTAILDGGARRVVARVRSSAPAPRSGETGDVPAMVVSAPRRRGAAVLGFGDCGPFTVPAFIGAGQLARIEREDAEAFARAEDRATEVAASTADGPEQGRPPYSSLVGWSRDGTRALVGFWGATPRFTNALGLFDTVTGNVVETLALGHGDWCSWESIQENPDRAEAVLRLVRLAPASSESDAAAESDSPEGRTYISPGRKRVAVLADDQAPRFLSRSAFERGRAAPAAAPSATAEDAVVENCAEEIAPDAVAPDTAARAARPPAGVRGRR